MAGSRGHPARARDESGQQLVQRGGGPRPDSEPGADLEREGQGAVVIGDLAPVELERIGTHSVAAEPRGERAGVTRRGCQATTAGVVETVGIREEADRPPEPILDYV